MTGKEGFMAASVRGAGAGGTTISRVVEFFQKNKTGAKLPPLGRRKFLRFKII